MASRALLIEANRKGKGPPDPYGDGTGLKRNPKWRAASLVAQACKADMMWQSSETLRMARGGYDVLIFNRALTSIGENLGWLLANPTATVFHLTNDILVIGGPLYVAAKLAKRDVHVIANYPRSFKTVPEGLVASWTLVNLNTLVYEPERIWTNGGAGCVYYGACRPERADGFRKYFRGDVTVATWEVLWRKFAALGIPGPWADRIPWHTTGLNAWKAGFYLENGPTPFFANRFYEALSYGRHTIFAGDCRETIARAGYPVPEALVVDRAEDIPAACAVNTTTLCEAWRDQATAEQRQVLAELATMIRGEG